MSTPNVFQVDHEGPCSPQSPSRMVSSEKNEVSGLHPPANDFPKALDSTAMICPVSISYQYSLPSIDFQRIDIFCIVQTVERLLDVLTKLDFVSRFFFD